VAKSDVWISNKNLDYVTVTESPMVIQGSQSIAEEIVKLNVGAQTPSNYKNFLKIGALITKADTAYENKDYQAALRLYTQVTKQQSLEKKKMMNAYVGLYRTNIHLRDLKAAEKAFGKLVALSIEEYYNGVKRKSKSIGKAWAENLVGSGTDNAQDAIDRRVEFKVVNCPVSDKVRKPKKIKSCVNSVSR